MSEESGEKMSTEKNDAAIVNIKNLNYKVGQRYLLRDITWEIKKGERWMVFGLNGSGTTTLLHIMRIIFLLIDNVLVLLAALFLTDIIEMKQH